MPFLAIHVGYFSFGLQLPLLHVRNILAQEKYLDRPAILFFKAGGYNVFPFRLAVADNMTFVGNDIFLFKKLPQIVRLEEIQEIFSCFRINGKGCLRFQELLIGAFPRRSGIAQITGGNKPVMHGFQVDHAIAGRKENVEATV